MTPHIILRLTRKMTTCGVVALVYFFFGEALSRNLYSKTSFRAEVTLCGKIRRMSVDRSEKRALNAKIKKRIRMHSVGPNQGSVVFI